MIALSSVDISEINAISAASNLMYSKKVHFSPKMAKWFVLEHLIKSENKCIKTKHIDETNEINCAIDRIAKILLRCLQYFLFSWYSVDFLSFSFMLKLRSIRIVESAIRSEYNKSITYIRWTGKKTLNSIIYHLKMRDVYFFRTPF